MGFGKEKMATTIGCEFCGASYGQEHEEWCPVEKKKVDRKKK